MGNPNAVACLLVGFLFLSSSWAAGPKPTPKPTSTPASAVAKPIPANPPRSQYFVQRSIGVGIITWPEQITVGDGLGNHYDANATFYTPSLSYSYRKQTNDFGLLYEGYLFYGQADIQTVESPVFTYFQKRVSVYGFGANVGAFFRPDSKQVNIGVSVPIQFRRANWTEPSGYSVDRRDVIAIGACLDLRWRLTQHLGINQRIGGFFEYKSALWMTNFEWIL